MAPTIKLNRLLNASWEFRKNDNSDFLNECEKIYDALNMLEKFINVYLSPDW